MGISEQNIHRLRSRGVFPLDTEIFKVSKYIFSGKFVAPHFSTKRPKGEGYFSAHFFKDESLFYFDVSGVIKSFSQAQLPLSHIWAQKVGLFATFNPTI